MVPSSQSDRCGMPEGVGARQDHDLLVIEAHAIEDIPKVLSGLWETILVCIRQAAIRREAVVLIRG